MVTTTKIAKLAIDVTLLTWKRADDDEGTILSLQNTLEEPAELKIEGDELRIAIAPFQTLTVSLHTTSHIAQGGTQ